MKFDILYVTRLFMSIYTREVNKMERKKENGANQYKGKGQLLKRGLTFMLATVIAFTSIPLNMAWADELPYFESPGDDEIILDDSVEEGDLSDIDLDISHTISKKGDKATVTVSAIPSESGLENGVTKITKVEIQQNGKLKKGKRSDDEWEFTVKENGVYSFVIYYSSDEGEEIRTATPSEIEKIEPTEVEPLNPGGNAGGAGGAGGAEATQPDDSLDVIPPETGETTDNPTADGNTGDDKTDNGTTEGDSNQNTPDEPDQNPSDNSGNSGTDEGKDNNSGSDDGSVNNGGDSSTDNDNSSSSENNSDTNSNGGSDSSSNGNDNSDSSGSNDSGSSSGGSSNSSNDSGSGSSDSGSSDSGGSGNSDSGSSDSSGSGSSDSGSSDSSGSDGDDSADTSVALNVIDFFFPVIEAQAGDFIVKKAVIVQYEITNLFPEGNPDDIDVDIFDEPTEEGAMITLLVEPSDIGLEKGVREITDITLIGYEAEEDSEIIETGEAGIATDPEAEEELIEEEEEIEIATPSEVSYDTSKSSSAKHAEYKSAENADGEYRFFVKENGTYTFSIRYGRAADLDFEDSTELVETQFTTTYELESVERGVQFTGVEDTSIQAGQDFDLLAGVNAISHEGMELPVVIQDNGGFNPVVPGTYTITYTVATRAVLKDGTTERTITVNPIAAGDLQVSSDVHGTEDGKTLVVPIGKTVTGHLSIVYDLPAGTVGRVLKIAVPEGTTASNPTDNIEKTYEEVIDGTKYKCYKIRDGITGELAFDIAYSINFTLADNAKEIAYLKTDGNMDIGQFHVIASANVDSDEVMMTEAAVGPLVTEKLEAGSEPRFYYETGYYNKQKLSLPASYDIYMNSAGEELYSYTINRVGPPGTELSERYFHWDVDKGYKPWIVKTMRIYAPLQFAFELDDYAKGRGVTLGEDDSGNSFVEIPYQTAVRGDQNSLNYLFDKIRIIPQAGITPDSGIHTAKNTEITYMDYGDTEIVKSVDPFIQINFNSFDNAKGDCLKVEGSDTSYPKNELTEWSDKQTYYISNMAEKEIGPDGSLHYKMPDKEENIQVTINYPGLLNARKWHIRVDEQDKVLGYEFEIEKVVLHLDSGETVNAVLTGSSSDYGIFESNDTVNPGNRHVDQVDIIFKKFYGVKAYIRPTISAGSVNSATEVRTTATLEDHTVENIYNIIPLETVRLFTSIDMQNPLIPSSAGKNTIYNGKFTIRGWGSAEQKGTNPKIILTEESLKYFTGGARFSKGFQGGKVRYTTSLGRTGEYEINHYAYSKDPYDMFVTLEDGEKLTELELSKEGMITYWDDTEFEMKIQEKEVSEMRKNLQAGEQNVRLEVTLSSQIDEKETAEEYNAEKEVALWKQCTISSRLESVTTKYQVYQGDLFNVSYPPVELYGTDRTPIEFVTYIKFDNADKLVFMGTGNSLYNTEVITKAGQKYIKVTQTARQMSSNAPSCSFARYYLPTLQFKALPGATPGIYPALSEIYMDVEPMLKDHDEILAEWAQDIRFSGLVKDTLNLTDSSDPDLLHMWKIDTKPAKGSQIEILQQSLGSVRITPGVGEIYSEDTIRFYPTQRHNLNAIVSVGSGASDLINYEVNIPVPKAGKEVNYTINGSKETVASDYNMYLKGEPGLVDNQTNAVLSYRLADETDFIDAAAVGGRWSAVDEIKMSISKLPAKATILIYLDLEAEDKGNVGLGEKNAYIAASYQHDGESVSYSPAASYIYQDFKITGKSWIDNNEDGRYDSIEPQADGIIISLLQNGTAAPDGSYSFSDGSGTYTLSTYLYEDLALKFEGLGGTTEGNKPTLKKSNSNNSISVFERQGDWTADLPAFFDEDQSGYDLGVVKLPVLIANNTQVGYKSEAQANVTVVNQANAPAVNSQIIYGAAADPTVAAVGNTGLIKGLKESSLTTATVSVKNSLGDEVSATYQIAVSDNKAPILTVHPWTAIEGDRIPDLWYGVTAEEAAEEYPAWRTALFGASRADRSIAEGNKSVTIYTNSDFTGEIALEAALDTTGLYYVRYSVKDEKDNSVSQDTTLTVYGKMQGADFSGHYFETGEAISIKNPNFYYLDTTGARVTVEGAQEEVLLTEGVHNAISQVVSHPKINDVTEGVTPGSGRTCTASLHITVDTKVDVASVPDYIALVGEQNVKVGWLSDTDGTYKHYGESGTGIAGEVLKTVADENGNVLSDTKTGNGIVEVDTSKPGVYQYVKTAEAQEDYDNTDDSGAVIRNNKSQVIKVTVIGKPAVEVPSAIYITPDKMVDEAIIKDKIAAKAEYDNGVNHSIQVPENQIKYQFNQTDGTINSVDITAWAGREDNISDPVRVEVVIRAVPVLTLPDIHLRKGTVYETVDFENRVLTPNDEYNTYAYVSSTLDTSKIGNYEALYTVSDQLTGAGGSQSQKIYVHGIPEITATDQTLYRHQSTGEEALSDVVKSNAKATVEYTKADGTTETRTIPADELRYEVSPDYVSGTAGRFKVTITANDEAYVPEGLEPMQVTKDVYVTVSDQLFDVTFSTNSDNFHNRGTIDGEAGPVVKPTNYGSTAVIAVPEANEGYHFDGFKTLSQMKATEDITLHDGTVIAAGNEIPVGTLLSSEQVQTIEIYSNVEYQAYFSATPVLKGNNIKLYVGENYRTAGLEIAVSDLDGDAQAVMIDDSHVDTDQAGTYQVKASVADGDQNNAEIYVYVQVYGKTELEGYDPIHIRSGQELSQAQLTDTVKAAYEAPPAVPDTPWDEKYQAAVSTEIPFIVEGEVNPQNIGLTKLAIHADGQITGHEADGQASEVRNIFVHGNPIITADDGSLYTHQSTSSSVLIDLIKQSAKASVQYVEEDGSIRTEQIPASKLNYEIKPEENYQAHTEGTYKVTIGFNDSDYVPNGLQPVEAALQAAVVVSDKAYSVIFSINNDNSFHRGEFEGGATEFSTNAIHGNPVGRVPVPVEAEGYHFDGFKTMTEFTAMDDILLTDGSTIAAGAAVPSGTLLTTDQIREIKISRDMEFQAYFSASPVIEGENIVLYEKEEYNQDKLHIEVTDLDQNAQQPVIDDSHVNTDTAGTYQVKVTVVDGDGNQAVTYLYVQVVGKTRFTENPDLHVRKGSVLTEEQLLEQVRAVYDKPEDIPETPWLEDNKTNNGHGAVSTAVEVRSLDLVNTDSIQKTKINLTASGMIHGREMTGKADIERNIYIHGEPVIVAYDNGLYTHQSTGEAVLEQAVHTGVGTLNQEAASAYVEYVQPDGSIDKVAIDPQEIVYTVDLFVPLTPGEYHVHAWVDDSSVLSQAPISGLAAAQGKTEVKVVVADKMYTVSFDTDGHGNFENPADSMTVVEHGGKVTAPVVQPDEGYIFDGWLDESGNKISNVSDIVITSDCKFTAQNKLKEFTVRFIGKNNRVLSTQIVKYGHDAIPPMDDPDVRDGKFKGWQGSYTNIIKDVDIYAIYSSGSGGSGGSGGSSGGGPSGGDRYVPSGPGNTPTTIEETNIPLNPFDNLVTLETTPVPTGNMNIPTFTGLPKTGDLSTGVKANIGYQATLIDGTRVLSEEESLVGHPNGGFIHVFEGETDWRKCILHVILLIISALEGIFYVFKRKKDKRLLEKLQKELEKEER